MDEQQVISLVKDGEAKAYRHLVERYQTGLIIHIENLVKDRMVAEDIAQETFVKAYYSIKKYDESKSAFSTWLYRIAINKLKDHLRNAKIHIDLASIEEMVGDEEAMSEAKKNEIREKVKNLQPPEYSKVIQAYFWEGKRYEDIAQSMSVPIGTVSTWMNRAKQALRKELA